MASRKDNAVAKRGNGNGNGNAIATLRELLESRKESLQGVIPANLGLDIEQLVRLTIASVSRNPHLLECSPVSIYAAVYDAVRWGVNPVSPQGHGYLVPRWNSKTRSKEASFQVGYKGLMHLARRFGGIRKMVAEVIVEGEEFRYDAANGEIHHVYDLNVDRTDETKFVGAYARAWLPDPDLPPETIVLGRAQVLARRAVSATKGGIWTQWPDRMWRKTALRTLLMGGIEVTPEFAQLLEHDAEIDRHPTQARVVERGVKGLENALGLDSHDTPQIEVAEEPVPVDEHLAAEPEPFYLHDDEDPEDAARREEANDG
jgi:recombination protein RecT